MDDYVNVATPKQLMYLLRYTAKDTDKTPILLSITPLELRSIRGYEPFSVHSGSVSGPLRSIPIMSNDIERLAVPGIPYRSKAFHSVPEI